MKRQPMEAIGLKNSLSSVETQHLEIPIMKALGACGGVEAVEMLYEIGKASMSPGVRRAAKEAIAKIQARLGDVEKGWLSPVQLQELDGALSSPGND